MVLTGWSFIRNYRNGTRLKEAADLVYDRFGRWLAISKMAHDVSREIEYLRSLPQVDGKRIGFMGFSLSAKAAVYVAAFNPDVKVTVAVDPHIAMNGGTNWYAPWYMDWQRKFNDIDTPLYPIVELRGTVQSLLNPDVRRPGFDHDHHELLALAAPRAFLLIGGSRSEDAGGDSDDLESWGYFDRPRKCTSSWASRTGSSSCPPAGPPRDGRTDRPGLAEFSALFPERSPDTVLTASQM